MTNNDGVGMGVDDRTPQNKRATVARSTSTTFPPQPLSFPVHLSQGQLNLLATCPRKFQHIYLEQLATPCNPDQQERLLWGARFHWLVQQWQMGLPVEPLARQDARLQRWFTAFVKQAPAILALEPVTQPPSAQSEHTRTLEWQGYLLTVVYDLLLTDRQQAKILDWKTYPRPQRSDWLQQNWQSRLYPFVLAETSGYDPEQISLTYWFFQSDVEGGGVPQSLTFDYNRVRHEQTRQDLSQLLQQLTTWLERYQQGEDFPQLVLGAQECDRCSFATRCDRVVTVDPGSLNNEQVGAEPADPPEAAFTLPSLADIQEVPL